MLLSRLSQNYVKLGIVTVHPTPHPGCGSVTCQIILRPGCDVFGLPFSCHHFRLYGCGTIPMVADIKSIDPLTAVDSWELKCLTATPRS